MTHALADTSALTGRSLRHILRSPDTIITTAVTPIAMLLLFVYVFGGAIDAGTDSYVTYLLPGILLITIASGIAYTSYRLFLDLQSGIFERFHSMPIARAPLNRRTPRRRKSSSSTAATSGSCWGSTCCRLTMRVTSQPNAANMWTNSTPVTPEPMTTRCSGGAGGG